MCFQQEGDCYSSVPISGGPTGAFGSAGREGDTLRKRTLSVTKSPEGDSQGEPDGKRRKGTDVTAKRHRELVLEQWRNRSSYTHQEIDPALISQKFAVLASDIIIAADTLSAALEAETPLDFDLGRYAVEDVEYLQPIGYLLQSTPRNAGFKITRIFMGWFLYRWIFRTPDFGYEPFTELITEVIRHISDKESTYK
jgi:hypothetical protein